MPNRNPIKQYFNTFPQSGEVDKEDFFRLHQKLGEIEYAKVALESHEDGQPHIHLLVIFKKGITKTKMLKFYKEEFPDDYKRIDVSAIRNISATLQYLEKEDTDFFETMPYQEYNPAFAKCEKARKVKWYNSELVFYNGLCQTNFGSGLELYNFLKSQTDSQISMLDD